MVWVKFLICIIIVLFAGTKAARYADIIAERTGLGRIWIGLILLAAMTSMPELITGVSSVALVKAPDMGLGTLLGSCIFNISIIALLDVLHRGGPVLNKASLKHALLAGIGVLLITITALGILIDDGFASIKLGWVGLPSIFIFTIYLFGAWRLSRSERNKDTTASNSSPQYGESSMKGVYWKFAVASVAVIGTGIWISIVGDEIAEVTGWGTSFVGSLLLAITTSMPELVVATAALRLGSIDLAVADILGANMLDISYIFILDLFYTDGSLLNVVSNSHLISSVILVGMSIVIILALRFKQKRKTFFFISWYAVILLALYIFGAYALFTSGIGTG